MYLSLPVRAAEKAAARHEEYSQLLRWGLQQCANGKRQDGIKTFEQCIAMRPEQPVAYANLGFTLRDDGDFFAALQPLLKAIELFEEGTEQWATTIGVAWFAYSADPILCDELPILPAWCKELEARLSAEKEQALEAFAAEAHAALQSQRAQLVEEAAAQNGLALQVNILHHITSYYTKFYLSSLPHTNFSLSFLS